MVTPWRCVSCRAPGKMKSWDMQSDGRIRIRLKAVPEGGKANHALIEFLAAVVQVPPSSIHIITGTSSQNKLVLFDGLDSREVISRIMGTTG